MGRRGPPPKPSAIRALEGDVSHRPVNKLEPKPDLVMPRCPSWLNAAAKKEWKRLAPMLHRIRVLTEADGDALAAYCQTYARWRQAEEFLDTHNAVYPIRDEAGRIKCMQQVPQVAMARNLLRLLRAYQQEFGMTPASRSRVTIVPFGSESEPGAQGLGDNLRARAKLMAFQGGRSRPPEDEQGDDE